MTQSEFGKKIGISQVMVSDIFSGKRNCKFRTAKKIAAFTNTDSDWWQEEGHEKERRNIGKILGFAYKSPRLTLWGL